LGPPDEDLLTILACPVTLTPLHYDVARKALVSREAGLVYPLRDGIPVLMEDEAYSLDRVRGGITPNTRGHVGRFAGAVARRFVRWFSGGQRTS